MEALAVDFHFFLDHGIATSARAILHFPPRHILVADRANLLRE